MPQNTPGPAQLCPLNTRFSYLWRAFSRNLQLSYRYKVNITGAEISKECSTYYSTVCGGFLPPVACVPARYCPAGWTVACPVFGWHEPVGRSAHCCRVLQEPEPDPTHSQFWRRAQMREGGRKTKTECALELANNRKTVKHNTTNSQHSYFSWHAHKPPVAKACKHIVTLLLVFPTV